MGDANIIINQGQSFDDPGASAQDDRDGNLTSSIVSTGRVNTSVIGNYTIEYAVSDVAGNQAKIERTVQVVDWLPNDFFGRQIHPLSHHFSWTAKANIHYSIHRSTDANCDLSATESCTDFYTLNDASSGVSDNYELNDNIVYYYWLQAKRDGNRVTLSTPIKLTAVDWMEINGDFVNYVKNTVPYTTQGSNLYFPPSLQQITKFRQLVHKLEQRDLSQVSVLATELGMDLIQVQDPSHTGNDIFCIKNKAISLKGWGLYCIDYHSTNMRHVSAPHPIKDSKTKEQAAEVMFGIGAKYLSISTTNRCANDHYSSCDGTTSICGTSEAFRVSDMAHNVDSLFHYFSIDLHDSHGDLITIQLHGCGSSSCPTTGTPIVGRFSVGSTTDLPTSELVNELAADFSTRVSTAQPGALVHSCNKAGDENVLCATTNPTGRYINGETASPCNTAGSTFLSSRFLHLEQNYDLRTNSGNDDPIKTALLIESLNNVLP